jgi:hypothetical protein
MHYCGLDVSWKSTHVYVEDAQGRQVTQGSVATTPTGLAGAYESRSKRATRRRGSRTCCGSGGRRSTRVQPRNETGRRAAGR